MTGGFVVLPRLAGEVPFIDTLLSCAALED